jgi:DNA-binding GntR family transcriptional regulator
VRAASGANGLKPNLERQIMNASSLYRGLAAKLREAIATGVYEIGQRLPTEHDLCDAHDVSRHTAREALRLLEEEGLIARRRGAGTIVVSTSGQRPFMQTVGEVADLLQYARDARLEIRLTSSDPFQENEAYVLGLDQKTKWVRIDGLRRTDRDAAPIALTRIFVRADLCPPRSDIDEWRGALNELISQRTGVSPARITQEIAAVGLSRVEARQLDAEQGAPALRTVRRYFDAKNRVFQASISLHPGDRFVYAMAISRPEK